MLPIVSAHAIFLCSRHVDFRKCFDGLCGEVREYMGANPLDRSLFVFYNRRRDRLKLLLWDDDGFWLFYKRLEQGTFEVPRSSTDEHSISLSAQQLQLILSGIELRSVRHRKRYKHAA
jgi:transposase